MGRELDGRMGPGVARLLLVNAAAFILLQTVVTAPGVRESLRFDPALLASRPWTVVSYALVHDNLVHLVVTSLLLATIGPLVERRMGTAAFLLFYLYCAVGAAAAALTLAELIPLPPMSGAVGAGLGLLYALALLEGDREVSLAPLPVASRLVMVATAGGVLVLVAAATWNNSAISLGHMTAVASAWLFFRVRSPRQPTLTTLPEAPARPRRTAIVTPRDDMPRSALPALEPRPAPTATTVPEENPVEALNRVLDKISATGLESLTLAERRLLTEYAERRKSRN